MGILFEDRITDRKKILKQELKQYLFQFTKEDFNEYGYLYTEYTTTYILEHLFTCLIKKVYYYTYYDIITEKTIITIVYKYKTSDYNDIFINLSQDILYNFWENLQGKSYTYDEMNICIELANNELDRLFDSIIIN